jgi:hypothetical protein
MSRNSIQGEWADQPADPEESDLWDDVDGWERIRTPGDSEQYVYLPEDEEMLRKDAFLVVDPSAVEDLVDNR